MSESIKDIAITLIDAAYGCEFISKTALAEVQYLNKEYSFTTTSCNTLAFFLMVLHHKMDNGDVCVKLDETSIKDTVLQWISLLNEKPSLTDEQRIFLEFAKEFTTKKFSDLLDILKSISAIGGADDDTPLVISLNRLYLRRYFNYERKVAAFISGQTKKEITENMLQKAQNVLNLLFGKNNIDDGINWQKVAAALPVFSRFCVISGGPGTGKTTTVLRILLLLRALYGLKPKIMLAAPTGKAASRMAQSIGSQLQNTDLDDSSSFNFAAKELAQKCGFDFSELLDSIPRNASTVHSLLNVIVHKVTPRYNEQYPLDLEIAFDPDTYVTYLTPYSRDLDTGALNSGLSLAIYRREFDGTFKEIASGLDSSVLTVVTDPHPALDYARYRIVATDNSTGAISYYDPPGYPIGDNVPIIIQWDEEWTDFEVDQNTAVRAQPVWSGSMLKLWYNIDVSDNNTPEVSLVNYIGRTYPVSYYGTSIDSSSSWSTEIPATDTETIYQLRRLAIWKGDCYVREPSGSGYWANVNVSFSKTHQELTIPVTLDITRVEGGI